jgi:hypothetical protein
LSPEILELVYAFPFGFQDRAHLIADFVSYIPCRDKAFELTELFHVHSTWL